MDAGEILLVLAAVSFGFFAKGVTGLGGPPLAIPVLAALLASLVIGMRWRVHRRDAIQGKKSDQGNDIAP